MKNKTVTMARTAARSFKNIIVLTVVLWMILGSSAFAASSVSHVIAHGGGSYLGYNTTNSVEALDSAVQKGYTLVELDFELTTDDKLALLHDWPQGGTYYLGLESGEPVSYEEYLNCKIMDKFTPLTIERIAEVLEANPELRIVTDTKEENIIVLTKISEACPQILNQFIPQIYQYDELEQVKELGYEQVILTCYKHPSAMKVKELISFAQKNELFAITMPYEFMEKGYAKKLEEAGVRVYFHTVNSLQDTLDAIIAGAHGVVSDTLLPEEVSYPNWQYYLTSSTNTKSQLAFEIQKEQLQLRMNCMNKNDVVEYYIAGNMIATAKSDQMIEIPLTDIPDGSYILTAKLFKMDGRYSTAKKYYIWKEDNKKVFLFGPQCKYLWNQYNGVTDMSDVASSYSEDTLQIARNSFIGKVGSSVYYQNGNVDMYRNGTAAIPAVLIHEQPHVPLRDTLLVLGADSVSMNSSNKTMTIVMNGKKQIAGISNAVKKSNKVKTTLKSEVTLYQNRAMADGDLLSELTGRAWIVQGDYMILLPDDANITDEQQADLFALAQALYQKA